MTWRGFAGGWAALITTVAAPRLSAGGEITIIDLTEAAVAAELIHLAQGAGLRPLVWVLPGDLPRLDLGNGLGPQAFADVLSLAAAAATTSRAGAGPPDTADGDAAAGCALLERVLGVLGPDPRLASVNAALRVLADIGDPLADVRAGLLTNAQLGQIGTMFRRGAAEAARAGAGVHARGPGCVGWTRSATAAARQAPTRLRVAALDRRAGVIGNQMLATYLVAATTTCCQAAPGEPWSHVICLLGAERLVATCSTGSSAPARSHGTGLLLAFQLGPRRRAQASRQGNAVIAFMRLGNGDEARAARNELIGTEHRFIIGQLTDTVRTSITDTWGESYTSTVSTSDSVADSIAASASSGGSRSRGRGRQLRAVRRSIPPRAAT